METELAFKILVGILVGASSGFLGSFMVLKRMSLVGDALSHVALPGMAIALSFGINPTFGALTALVLAVIGVWYLGEKTEVYSETLVGVFFTASLAIGILLTPEPELLEALFGDFEKIGIFDGVLTIFASFIIYFVARKLADKIILEVVSRDLAQSSGVKVSEVNFIYLLLVGLVVAMGVKFVGTLLMGALVIVPAAAAKNLARNIRSFQALSASFGILSVIFGILFARFFEISSGPSIVLVSIGFFILSYFFRKN